MTHHDPVAAKCTETGIIEYWTCDVCEKYFSDEAGTNEINSSSLTVPAKGHSWKTPTYEWSSDYSKCTAKKVCANDSTHVVTETVDATMGDDVSASNFDNPVLNMTVTAEFEDSDFAEQSETVSTKYNGQVPLFNSDESLVKYGLYPQKNVNDAALNAALDKLEDVEDNGWYLYEGAYYIKTVSDPYHIYEHFDNGDEIELITEYWFKCEPIIWNVLSNDKGEYYLLSSVLLEFYAYDADGDNHYVDSDIRAWLNGDFYNKAFGLEDSYIKTTTVDNSADTTEWLPEDYSCDSTEDKVI